MDIPKHIAIIMDGNGRWAQSRHLPRTAGHRKGAQRVKEIVSAAKAQGVKAVTFFAFSTENWSRSGREINALFSILQIFLKQYRDELMRENIRFKVIGRRDRLGGTALRLIESSEKLTADNKSFTFVIAVDYGGRWDIANAVKEIVSAYKYKKISETDINEEMISRHMALADVGDPDLLIRTSGEQRISNFLLWNLAYSEFYFPHIHWPDFDSEELAKAISVYKKRERRFGSAG